VGEEGDQAGCGGDFMGPMGIEVGEALGDARVEAYALFHINEEESGDDDVES
jgi:hypothetical protein